MSSVNNHVQTAQHAVDYSLGTSAATSPFWLPWVHQLSSVAAYITVIGGAILVVLRIGLALREWRRD